MPHLSLERGALEGVERVPESRDLLAHMRLIEELKRHYQFSTAADTLRAAIVEDERCHGTWHRLRLYEPLPEHVAEGVADYWRRARPESYGGAAHFQARIDRLGDIDDRVPIYAVEVMYMAV